MKELEKTKRISISAVLFLLVIIIAVLTFERPKHVFENNTEAMLQEISNNKYLLTMSQLEEIESSKYKLIDVRSNFEYSKGFLKDAVNISTNDILEDDNIKFLDELQESDKTAILYGENPDQANSAYMMLYQLGYENVYILSVQTNYSDNNFNIKNYELEKPTVNYAKLMQKLKFVPEKPKPKITKPKPKKVVPIKKKKKKKPEGGC